MVDGLRTRSKNRLDVFCAVARPEQQVAHHSVLPCYTVKKSVEFAQCDRFSAVLIVFFLDGKGAKLEIIQYVFSEGSL